MKPKYPMKDVVMFDGLLRVIKLTAGWDWQALARLTPDDEWEMVASVPDVGFVRAAENAMVYVYCQCQRQN